MKLSARKLLTVVTEATLEQELTRKLESFGAAGYTISDVRGKGHSGIRNSAWNLGANIRIEVVCDTALVAAITNYLKEHYYANYAMIIFVSDVQVLRPAKF